MRCFFNQTGTSEPTVYTQYLYAGGARVKKITRKSSGDKYITVYIDGIFEHSYHLDGSNTMDEELNELHIMDDQTRVAMLRTGYDDGTPETKYILSDHLGSSNVILETDGSVYNREEYYPFGETSFGSFGKKRYRYVGKEKDEESGLYYYGARYFQPWSCRFISVDPLAGKYNFQSSYVYADNNPICKMDFNGEGTGQGLGPGGNTTQYITEDENGVKIMYNSVSHGNDLTQVDDLVITVKEPVKPDRDKSEIEQLQKTNPDEAKKLQNEWNLYEFEEANYPSLLAIKNRIEGATAENDLVLYKLKEQIMAAGKVKEIVLVASSKALYEGNSETESERVFAITMPTSDEDVMSILFDLSYIDEAPKINKSTKALESARQAYKFQAPPNSSTKDLQVEIGSIIAHELGHVLDFALGNGNFSSSNRTIKEMTARKWERDYYLSKHLIGYQFE